MRPLRRALYLAVATAALSFAPSASSAEAGMAQVQLRFPQGQSETTVKGSISGRNSVDYTLRAAAGQTLQLKLSGRPSAYYNVLAPGSTGEALFIGSRDGTESSTVLPTGGVYTVRVYQMGQAASSGQRTSFTLTVRITGGATPSAGSATGADDKLVEAAARAGAGKFNATGKMPCAQAPGQPMSRMCDFGVARAGGGTAVVSVTLPDGRKRALFFKEGKATGADLSQADGNMNFSVTKEADLYMIRAGNERYELVEAVVFGG